MQKGLINVKPLITHTVSIDDAVAGFKLASDRTQAMKAQIIFA
jgi:L-idonate 5-dehydrogenase